MGDLIVILRKLLLYSAKKKKNKEKAPFGKTIQKGERKENI